MKNSKSSVFLRYEFSNESGRPEGGDVFEFSSLAEVQEMIRKVVLVAQGDKVAVNLTVGIDKPFYGFLGNVGLSRADLQAELVDREAIPADKAKPAGKKATKKAASTQKKATKKATKKAAKK
jgi:hypothetical protein